MHLLARPLSKRYSSLRVLLVGAGLLLGATAQATEVTWTADSPTNLDVQVAGAIMDGAQMSVSYESPSGLWNVSYSFSIGSAGFDSKGDELYRLNVGIRGGGLPGMGTFFF